MVCGPSLAMAPRETAKTRVVPAWQRRLTLGPPPDVYHTGACQSMRFHVAHATQLHTSAPATRRTIIVADQPLAGPMLPRPRYRQMQWWVTPPLRLDAHVQPSSSAPKDLAQFLLCVAAALPTDDLALVLRHLPVVELARLACVHKVFCLAWQRLQDQHPGGRYSRPSPTKLAAGKSRLTRAGYLGDVAVIRSMFAAGVDERGKPLLAALEQYSGSQGRRPRAVDVALCCAACGGHVEAVELLLGCGAQLHADEDAALRKAAARGRASAVKLLLQHGANPGARGAEGMRLATLRGHTEVVEVLTEHGWNEIAAGLKLFGFDLPLYAARKDQLRQDAAEDDAS